MKITVICVGKVKEKFYREAITEFSKRLSGYCRLEIIEVADEKTPDSAGEALEEQIKKKEASRILKYIKEDAFLFTLEIQGKQYDSVELFNNIGFLLIFLFGLSNAINFGEKYTLALTFVALITDTQWDTADAIVTNATIDISKNNFNYKEHKRNAYKLLGILFLTSLIMFSLLYRFYDLDFKITMIYFTFEIVNFLIYPIYRIKTCYLQLEWSSFKTTGNKIFSLFLRMLLSLTKTPFCTGIGQACSSVYQFITVSIFFKLNFKVDKKGNVIRKKME